MNDAIRMQISAFVDGELPDNESDLLLRRMGQDVELRQAVADYLAIGRMMRGESAPRGVDRIHERVSAAINDKPLDTEQVTLEPPAPRVVRPLVGIAIAASVALLAIFGLQQTTDVESQALQQPVEAVAATVPDSGYTVPRPIDDQLRQYYLSHGATALENGANGMNTRFVNLRLGDEVFDEPAPADDVADESDAETVEQEL